MRNVKIGFLLLIGFILTIALVLVGRAEHTMPKKRSALDKFQNSAEVNLLPEVFDVTKPTLSVSRDGADDEPPRRTAVPWPNLTFSENELLERTVVIDSLDLYFEDDEDHILRYDLNQTNEQIFHCFGAQFTQVDGVHAISFQFLPYYNTWGDSVYFIIRCSDSHGHSISDVIPASIDSVNYPPQVIDSVLVLPRLDETDGRIDISIPRSNLANRFWDPDTNLVDLHISDAPDELGLSVEADYPRRIFLDITPNFNTHAWGERGIRVGAVAVDSHGESAALHFNVVVEPDENDSISAGVAGAGFENRSPANNYVFGAADSLTPILFGWSPAIQNRWETDSIAYHIRIFTQSRDTLRFVVLDDTTFEIPMDSLIRWSKLMERPNNYICLWNVYAIDRGNRPLISLSGAWMFMLPHVSGVEKEVTVKTEFGLSAPYPNPFNGSTVISFDLDQTSLMDVGVFDIAGRRIATLANGQFEAGQHRLVWNAEAVPTGIYFVKAVSSSGIRTSRMALVR